MDDNFLTKSFLTMIGVLCELLQTEREGCTEGVNVEGRLGCSDSEIVEFSVG